MTDTTASSTMPLGVEGFTYADLYEPARLRELHERFDRWFAAESPAHHARFDAYRACKGEGMTAVARSEALLAAAPYVGHFVAKLFAVETEAQHFREMVRRNDPLWRFKKDFVKKRVLKDSAGKGWARGPEAAEAVAKAALQAMTPAPVGGTTDEERTIATAALPLLDTDE
ncbi:MAG: pyridine nucleotide-disulfide oxidoreductase, partial [Polyangiaceae bacterium]